MKILLIYPEFPDTFWSFKHALSFIHRKASFPPLGLLTVGAMLPASWETRLIDLNVTRLKDKDLAWADHVFLSAMIVQRGAADRVIERCRAAGVRIVAGGPLFSTEHEQFVDTVDHLVIGEGETVMAQLAADLEQGCARKIYRAEEFPSLAESPAPKWSLVNVHRYAALSLQYSRGCPFNCDFCNVTTLFGHKVRTKTVPQVLEELNGLHELGWGGQVFFVDDNLIGNKQRIKRDLLPALIDWRKQTGSRITFNTEVSINLADDEELMSLMVQAGFNIVFIGVETPDDAALVSCSKGQNTNRDMVADIKRIQRAGLEVQGGFIVGFDTDEPNIFQRQIDFIQQSGIVTAMVGLLQAPPGTRLYKRMRDEGRLLGESTGDNVDGSTNIIPRMDLALLQEGYRRILTQIYSPRYYYKRVRTFLREHQPGAVMHRVRVVDVMAFLASIVRLGVLGKERLHYWHLLFWTAFKRPDNFATAVTLAIYGYHFRRVCELHVARR